MKKALSIILAAAMMISASSFAFAEEQDIDAETNVLESTKALTTEGEDVTEDAQADLLAKIDGITFEYDTSSPTNTRVVRVKYDQGHFSDGINKFRIEVTMPPQYIQDVSSETRMTNYTEEKNEYSNGTYVYEISRDTNQVPTDGLLCTMTIQLTQNIVSPFTISLAGNTYVGAVNSDGSTDVQTLANGLNPQSLELPADDTDGFEIGGTFGAVTWGYDGNGTLVLSGSGTVPDFAQGEAPWYARKDKITSIVFGSESNFDNIGANSFYGLDKVESVKFCANIGTIGNGAFDGCTSLKSVDFPETSTVGIGDHAFRNCSSLNSVEVPKYIKSIGKGAFVGCTKLTSLTLPFIGQQRNGSGVKFPYVFDGDAVNVPRTLKTVTITNDTDVPVSAFEGCEYIENIYINDEVTTIGASAFKNCKSLVEFTFPTASGMTDIADKTFQYCTSLKRVNGMEQISSIGTSAFDGCTSLEEIYISDKVKAINNYTFRNCSTLTEIEIPNSVTSIGIGVLTGCMCLVDINIPFVGANATPDGNDGNSVFGYLFGADNALEKNMDNIPASVTKVIVTYAKQSGFVPEKAFANCSNIQDIMIYNCRRVGNNAFLNCRNLRNLYLPDSVTTIEDTILAGCKRLEALTVPFIGYTDADQNSEKSVLGGFFGWDENAMDGTIQYYDGTEYKNYLIPDTLKTVFVLCQINVPQGAFYNCDFIENVSIIKGRTLGDQAFQRCRNLKSVRLPDDMEEIGYQAFGNCEKLETVNLPGSTRKIGDGAFYGCALLDRIAVPETVDEIASNAFSGTVFSNKIGVSDDAGLESVDETADLMANNGVLVCVKGSKVDKGTPGVKKEYVDSTLFDLQDINPIMSKISTGEYVVNVSCTASTGGTIYAALYDSKGKILSVKHESVGSSATHQLTFAPDEASGFDHAKVMIFGNDMEPQTQRAAQILKSEVREN